MRGKLAAVLLLAVSTGTLLAQGGGRGGGRQGQLAGPPPGADSMRPDRAQLEQRLRQRMGQVLKNRLGLNDAQMTKLQETNKRYDEKRRILVDQERDIRMSLRDEMLRPDSARQPQVGGLLDRMVKVQRQRVDVFEQEQKELSGFLTPIQRLKYFTVEEQMRQRMQQMRQQQMGGRGGRGGRGGQQMQSGQMPTQPGMQGRGAQMRPMMPGMQGRGGRGRGMVPPDTMGGPPRVPPPENRF
jgi:hypothetical protein